MKYFKGFIREKKPFIVFCQWASSLAELQRLGAQDDPLILPENNLPEYQFGVYPIKIVDGEFVEHTPEEMDVFQAEFEVSELLLLNKKRIETLNEGTFTYGGNTFPMDEASRNFYNMMPIVLGNQKIYDTSGTLRNVNEEDIPDFMVAFQNQVYTITKHNDE